jgi:hypothetical protein
MPNLRGRVRTQVHLLFVVTLLHSHMLPPGFIVAFGLLQG